MKVLMQYLPAAIAQNIMKMTLPALLYHFFAVIDRVIAGWDVPEIIVG
ncbi:TPA: hypothetical protein ACXHWU_002687 [Morganella morganii]